jgi:hypothetical protein
MWLAGLVLLGGATAASAAPAEDPAALADKINRFLEKSWAANQIKPAAPADDAEWLRRVYLDLAGRIPSKNDVESFLKNKDPDKRRRVIQELLFGSKEKPNPRYPLHFTNVWRATILPESANNNPFANQGGGFSGWLYARFSENAPYDKMARELLTATQPNQPQQRGFPVDPFGAVNTGPSPIGFYQAKQFMPENLAETTARLLLGVRLGCAQCHNHPFASWKQEQFWEYAAFFSGMQPRNPRGEAPATPRELKIPGTEKIAKAKFLDGKLPKWDDAKGGDPRLALADWVTSPDNPFFARATVNRMWGYFFGVGLIDPIDEMVGDNVNVYQPELLDEIAKDFAAHNFDLKYLIEGIMMSKAYQLTSKRSDESQDTPGQFARMPLRGMTPEQLYDSVVEATHYGEGGNDFQAQFRGRGGNARAEFVNKFSNLSDRPTEYQTSIVQALMLMNGQLTADATVVDLKNPERGRFLGAVVASPFMDTPQRIETLYLATLSRKPKPQEIERATKFIDAALRSETPLTQEEKDKRYGEAIGDIFWALFNSGEFFFNH